MRRQANTVANDHVRLQLAHPLIQSHLRQFGFATSFTAPGYDHELADRWAGRRTAALHEITKPQLDRRFYDSFVPQEEKDKMLAEHQQNQAEFENKLKAHAPGLADADRWQLERHWEHGMRRALTQGHIGIDEAEQRGYRSDAREHGDVEHGYYHPETGEWHGETRRHGGWQPLPDKVFHVSTNADAVQREGLKTPEELGRGEKSVGLGGPGGGSDAVSVTDDPRLPPAIYHSLHERHAVLTGKIKPEQLEEYAKHPPVGKPFHEEWKSQHLPEFFDEAREKVKIHQGMTVPFEQIKKDHDEGRGGWQIRSYHPQQQDSLIPPIPAFWHRPATDQEHHETLGYLHTTFSRSRHYAGGHRDPMFVSSDPHAFAQVDPKQFGILHLKPHEGAQGYPLRASKTHHEGADSGEWRMGGGSPFNVTRVEKPEPRHIHEFGLDPKTGAQDGFTRNNGWADSSEEEIARYNADKWSPNIRDHGPYRLVHQDPTYNSGTVTAHERAGGRWRGVGYLSYTHNANLTGHEIYKVHVDPAHQRRGLASAMLDLARESHPDLQHSPALTDEGRSWAEKTGAEQPKSFNHDELEEHLQRVFQPQQLEARRETHPKSGFPVEVGERRRLDHVADDVPGWKRDAPLHEWSAPARLRVHHFGDDVAHRPWFPEDKGTEPLQHVYRGVSMDEYHQARERGYLDSDRRGVITHEEGTNAAIDPRSAVSYLPPGQHGMVLKIKAKPEHDWRMIRADDYVRTQNRIPMSDVEHAEPFSKSKEWRLFPGHVDPKLLDDERHSRQAATTNLPKILYKGVSARALREIQHSGGLQPSEMGESGPGVYLTRDHEYAKRYAGMGYSGGAILHVEHSVQNPLVRNLDDEHDPGDRKYRHIQQMTPGGMTNQGGALGRALAEQGHDAVETTWRGRHEIAVHDPAKLRIVHVEHVDDEGNPHTAVQQPPEGLTFVYSEQQSGGSKWPTRHQIGAIWPGEPDRHAGVLNYFTSPTRKKILIDNLSVPHHPRNGIGSALMDELQRRHPDASINHGDRTDDGKAWWSGYTQDKTVRRGRTAGLDDDDYRMQHRPPGRDGIPMHDMTVNLPADVYTHPHYYSDMSEPSSQHAHREINRVRGRPDAKVHVYRALPAEHAHQGIRPGDWVSISKDYAKHHGTHAVDPKHDWPVIRATVRADELHTDGDDLREFGYNGDEVKQGTVAFKGGYHQEVRQHADGTIRQVQRKQGPLTGKGYSFTAEHDHLGGTGGTIRAWHHDDYAGHMHYNADGSPEEPHIEPEHQHLADELTRRMRMKLPPRTGAAKQASRVIPCTHCKGRGTFSNDKGQSWDCPTCKGAKTLEQADHWDPPELPPEQRDALGTEDHRDYRSKSLQLAKNPVPGTVVWRGEVRHKDDLARPPSVGMHWSVKPEQASALHPPTEMIPEDHHKVLWEARIDDPEKQTIPRSHPVWYGRHQSMDSEAEVRFKPGTKVHLRAAYLHDGRPGRSMLSPLNSEYSAAGWTKHPMGVEVPIEHKRTRDDGMMEYQEHFPDLFKNASMRMVRPSQVWHHIRTDVHPHRLDAIRDSVAEHGWQPDWNVADGPIKVSLDPPVVSNGSHRLHVLRELGRDEPIPMQVRTGAVTDPNQTLDLYRGISFGRAADTEVDALHRDPQRALDRVNSDLGRHWTTDYGVARHFAHGEDEQGESELESFFGPTPEGHQEHGVVLHAKVPVRNLAAPGKEWGEINPQESVQAEHAIRPGTPVHLHGATYVSSDGRESNALPGKIASLSDEDRVSVAEQAMERGGLAGRRWHVPKLHQDDPGREEAQRPVHEFVNGVMLAYGQAPVRVVPAHWDLRGAGSGQAQYDPVHRTIGLAGEHTNDMTLLHELAHAITSTKHPHGHGREFQQAAHDLYREHLGPEAAETFANIVASPQHEGSKWGVPGGEADNCRCGLPIEWDEIDGWQHADGSISHDGEFDGKSVSDLVGTTPPKTARAESTYHYHVSPVKNRDSIAEHGLQPGDGGRIWLYPHQEQAEAHRDVFGGDRDIYRVDVSGYRTAKDPHLRGGAGSMEGRIIRKAVPPERIERIATRTKTAAASDFEYRYSQHESGSHNYVTAHDPQTGERLGDMTWHAQGPSHHVTWVAVYDEENRRKGIGTGMWNKAREVDPQVIHNPDTEEGQTDAGRAWARTTAARTTPHERVFGPTYGLDHRLWDGDKLKEPIREDIIARWRDFCIRHGYVGWSDWAKIVFFGSEASEWTSPSLVGNNDFDLSVGLEFDRFRQANGSHAALTDAEIALKLTGEMHRELNDPQHVFPGVEGVYDQTWFANLQGWDIARIKPYSAWDVIKREWIVKPPHLPDWDISKLPHPMLVILQAAATTARNTLKLPEPERTSQGARLYEMWHEDRSNAFGPQGQGWIDLGNLREKFLDQLGLWHGLWEAHHRAAEMTKTAGQSDHAFGYEHGLIGAPGNKPHFERSVAKHGPDWLDGSDHDYLRGHAEGTEERARRQAERAANGQHECPDCLGSGRGLWPGQSCKGCDGSGALSEQEAHRTDALYHVTDNPNFKLDPQHVPEDNALAISSRERPGLFAARGRDVSHWTHSQGYVRPYIAELHVPRIAHGPGRWGGERFIPAENFDQVKVNRVIPLSAHEKEQHEGKPYRGPDARDMTPQQHARHKQHALDQLRNEHGFGDEDIDHLRQHWARLARALPKQQKCKYCTEQATYRVVHSEGIAYLPCCDKHLDKAKDDAAMCTPDGSRDESNIDAVRKIAAYEHQDAEDEECEDCGGAHPTEACNDEGDHKTDWASIWPHVTDLHRGINTELPQHVHDVVHDQSRPIPERAHALMQHLQNGHHGMHWTDSPEQAEHYTTSFHGPGATPVRISGRKPDRDWVEEDDERLKDARVLGYDMHEDREVPLQPNAPVPIHSISWGEHGSHELTHHHRFDQPITVRAVRTIASYADYLRGGGLDQVADRLYSQPQHHAGESWNTAQHPDTVAWVKTDEMIPLRHHDGTQNGRSPEITHHLTEGFKHGEGWISPLQLNYAAEDHKAWLGEGNHRLEAAHRAGEEYVPVTIAPTRSGHLPPEYRDAPFPKKMDSYEQMRGLRGQSGDTIHPVHVLPHDWLHPNSAPTQGKTGALGQHQDAVYRAHRAMKESGKDLHHYMNHLQVQDMGRTVLTEHGHPHGDKLLISMANPGRSYVKYDPDNNWPRIGLAENHLNSHDVFHELAHVLTNTDHESADDTQSHGPAFVHTFRGLLDDYGMHGARQAFDEHYEAPQQKTATEGWYQHRPPGPPRPEDYYEGGQPAHDLDFNRSGSSRYDSSPERRVRTLFDHPDTKVIRTLMQARGNPEHPVTMYRALPHEHVGEGFRTGDWVTLSKAYAQSHARGRGGWPVIKATVPAKHLWTEGDFNEWGYHGEPTQGEIHTPGRQVEAMGQAGPDYDNLSFEHMTGEQYGAHPALHDHQLLFAKHPEHGYLGHIRYSLPSENHDDIKIHNIDIRSQHRRRGVASQLMAELERRHPDTVIDHGQRSPSGTEWAKSFYGDEGPALNNGQQGWTVAPKTRNHQRVTGAVKIDYMRNNSGMRQNARPGDFEQEHEPWGRYYTPRDGEHAPQGWETGTVHFDNPLHMDWEDGGWKRRLSEQYGGATGKQLSRALLEAGHDGVVTHDPKYGPMEFVDVRPKQQRGHIPDRQAALA